MIKNKQRKKLFTQCNQLCLLKQCVVLTMKYFWKASMVYSTVSSKTTKHPENKAFWAGQKVNKFKSTNLGFLFSINNKAK